MIRRCSLPVFALLLLTALATGGPTVVVETSDDSLPQGARARIGTLRFRDGREVRSAVLASDGKTVATLGPSGVRVWDIDTGHLRCAIADAGERIVLSPNGRVVAVIGQDSPLVRLWDTSMGKKVREFQTAPVSWDMHELAFSADGKYLCAGSPSPQDDEADLRVWDVTTGRTVGPFRGGSRDCHARFAPDGRTLALGVTHTDGETVTGSWKWLTTIQLWELATGKERSRLVLEEEGLCGLAYSPDGRTLAVATDERISLWDTSTFRRLVSWRVPRGQGHNLTFAPDGRSLAATSWSLVQEWDTTNGRRRGAFAVSPTWRPRGLAYSPTGQLLHCASNGMVPLLSDVRTGRLLNAPAERTVAVERLDFLKGGSVLAITGAGGVVQFWDVPARKEPARVTILDYPRDEDPLRELAPAPNGKYLFGSFRQWVYLWDVPTGQYICVFPDSDGTSHLAISPDSRLLACPSQRCARLWDVETGEIAREIPLKEGEEVAALAFAPDSKLIALGGSGLGGIRLHDTEQGTHLRTLATLDEVLALTFSGDGKLLAVRRKDGDLHLWDLQMGEMVRRFRKFDGQYTAPMLFTPDGRTLVAAGQRDDADGVILLWDVATGKLRRQLAGHRGVVAALAISPDGKLLASGGSDTTVLLWDLSALAK